MSLDAAVYADDEQEEQIESIWIGNIALVAALREEVGALDGGYPLVLGRVLYNGVHCGDEIKAAEVETLRAELLRLPEGSSYLQRFRAELLALCELALERGRPIVF